MRAIPEHQQQHKRSGEEATWAGTCAQLSSDDANFLIALTSRLILVHASNFSRRIFEVIQEFPYKILLLLKSKPTTVCETRKAIASEILDTATGQLHIVGQKMKDLYSKDLEHARKTGHLSTWLYMALSEVSIRWRADTRESERETRIVEMSCFVCNDLRLLLAWVFPLCLQAKPKTTRHSVRVRKKFWLCVDN